MGCSPHHRGRPASDQQPSSSSPSALTMKTFIALLGAALLLWAAFSPAKAGPCKSAPFSLSLEVSMLLNFRSLDKYRVL